MGGDCTLPLCLSSLPRDIRDGSVDLPILGQAECLNACRPVSKAPFEGYRTIQPCIGEVDLLNSTETSQSREVSHIAGTPEDIWPKLGDDPART